MRPLPLTSLGACCLLFAACGGKTGLWDLQTHGSNFSPPPGSGGSGAAQDSGGGESSLPQDGGTAGSKPEAGLDAAVDTAQLDVKPAPGCPVQLPALASTCSIEGQICAYKTGKMGPCDDVGTDDQSAYRCEEGRWLVIARCVDWSPCPEQPPADGSPCTITGLDCFYSSDKCAAESLAQCTGAIWRHANACVPGSVQGCLGLVETLSPDAVLGAEEGKDLSMPAMALAGTQAFITFLRSAGSSMDHDIYATLVQTAVPSMASLYNVPGFKMGRDAVTNPVVAFGLDRFVVAWGANDGWPSSTTGIPVQFVRRMRLDSAPDPDVLIDSSGTGPTGLALDPTSGWLGYRSPAPSDPTKYAATRIALGVDEAPIGSTSLIVADESKSDWFALPVPNATARVARHLGGTVIAFPATASGDLWDDSGIVVEFFAPGAQQSKARVRATVGLPQRLSVAALRDGSAMIAYTLVGQESDPLAIPFHMARVYADGKHEQLPDPMTDGQMIAFGPKVVAAQDGVALLWTTQDPNAPNPTSTMYVALVGPDGSYAAQTTRTLSAVGSNERFDLAYSDVDRAVHVVWSPVSGLQPGPDRVLYQRYVCGMGIK